MGFLTGFQLILITLKLLGKIEWSWLWVMSPVLLYVCVIVVAYTLVFVLGYGKEKHK